MSGALTTHVLDLTVGRPGAGLTIELWRAGAHVKTVIANADGRTDAALLSAEEIAVGEYELVFHVGAYFGHTGFLDRVPVRFRITNASERYHVPLLCSPWAYSTYRGS